MDLGAFTIGDGDARADHAAFLEVHGVERDDETELVARRAAAEGDADLGCPRIGKDGRQGDQPARDYVVARVREDDQVLDITTRVVGQIEGIGVVARPVEIAEDLAVGDGRAWVLFIARAGDFDRADAGLVLLDDVGVHVDEDRVRNIATTLRHALDAVHIVGRVEAEGIASDPDAVIGRGAVRVITPTGGVGARAGPDEEVVG